MDWPFSVIITSYCVLFCEAFSDQFLFDPSFWLWLFSHHPPTVIYFREIKMTHRGWNPPRKTKLTRKKKTPKLSYSITIHVNAHCLWIRAYFCLARSWYFRHPFDPIPSQHINYISSVIFVPHRTAPAPHWPLTSASSAHPVCPASLVLPYIISIEN